VAVTGSFNFTKAAETSNAENVLVMQDATLAEKYIKNWLTHFKHSEPYQGRCSRAQSSASNANV
jgi:phosphatidylserine/phosphatidylglycerophosphate/cardiolipin synthase-like enzyme